MANCGRNPNLQLVDLLVSIKRTPEELKDPLLGPRSASWYTGKIPKECPGFIDGKLHGIPQVSLRSYTRKQLMDYFDNAWTLTELLFASLQGESSFYISPYHNLRHPFIFYLCHPACLYINKLQVAGLLKGGVNSHFEAIFEVGVDEMSWDNYDISKTDWPKVSDVMEYRSKVYQIIKNIIETHPLLNGHEITMDSPLWAIHMGIEHEHIHLETSSVLVREFPYNRILRPTEWPENHPSFPDRELEPLLGSTYPINNLIEVKEGVASVGKPNDFPSYSWDCDYGSKQIKVDSFKASSMKISNGEFWRFVSDGGYREKRYWTETGWKWRSFRNAKWPTFWISQGPSGAHKYRLRLLFDVVEMPWSWPVEANVYEAEAYCAWLSEKNHSFYSLPSEAQLHRIRGEETEVSDSNENKKETLKDPIMVYDYNKLASKYNFNVAYSSSTPTNNFSPNELGFYDLLGNVYEWTRDTVYALDGYKPHPFYDDFSSPCMDGKHHIILGGSFISMGNCASKFARYHFRPHFFQHCGFRIVEEKRLSDAVGEGAAKYELDKILSEYLNMHFGKPNDVFPYPTIPYLSEALDFPKKCADVVIQTCVKKGVKMDRALDLGCAVGRAVFELSPHFKESVGVDLSNKFIDACNSLCANKSIHYQIKNEGLSFHNYTATIPSNASADRCRFAVGDCMNLSEDLGTFDAILIANVICRLPDPLLFLDKLPQFVREKGIVVITTPFSWFEEYTPVDKWLGGYQREGRQVDSLTHLKEIMGERFELIDSFPLTMLIREHVRKFQLVVPTCTVWQKK